MEEMDIDEVWKLISKKMEECKQKDGSVLKNSDIKLLMARIQEVDEILRKPLYSFKQLICFEPAYFDKDGMTHMILCSPRDEELSCPVTKLRNIDKDTLLAQERLLSLMGEFALPWKYINKEKSELTVQPIHFTFEQWYSYLLTEFHNLLRESPIVKRAGISWFSFLKFRLYPLLRLCTKWLKCAIECGVCHGDLMNNIYFKTDMKPQLLIRIGFDKKDFDKKKSGDGCGSWRGDLETIKHFLFVIVNGRPLKELQKVNQLDYRHFNDDVPRYLTDFLGLLGTFNEKKHIVDVVFNPSFLWSTEKKNKHLDEAFIYFIRESRVNELWNHSWWKWYAELEELPNEHPLKNELKQTGSLASIQPPSKRSRFYNPNRYYNPNYRNDADLLRVFRNVKCHFTEMFPNEGWTLDFVLEEFEEKFNILSKLSQTCDKYAVGLRDKEHDKKKLQDFLKRLGYITRETPYDIIRHS